MDDEVHKEMAKIVALNCVRNTILEDYHSEGVPIDDKRMKIFMKDVVNKLYTFFKFSSEGNPEYLKIIDMMSPQYSKWDEPELCEDMVEAAISMKNVMKNIKKEKMS